MCLIFRKKSDICIISTIEAFLYSDNYLYLFATFKKTYTSLIRLYNADICIIRTIEAFLHSDNYLNLFATFKKTYTSLTRYKRSYLVQAFLLMFNNTVQAEIELKI